MATLEGIQIENYRALRNVSLGKPTSKGGEPLPRLMAVIGVNGSGKSISRYLDSACPQKMRCRVSRALPLRQPAARLGAA